MARHPGTSNGGSVYHPRPEETRGGGVPGLGRDCQVLCLQLSQLIPGYFGPFIKMASSPGSTNTDSRKM